MCSFRFTINKTITLSFDMQEYRFIVTNHSAGYIAGIEIAEEYDTKLSRQIKSIDCHSYSNPLLSRSIANRQSKAQLSAADMDSNVDATMRKL